jgi:hypothetical protein
LHTIGFEKNENSFKFIITLESFVSKVSINLAKLVQNVEIHKLYVKGQIENPFHIEKLYVLAFYFKCRFTFVNI